MKIIKIISVVLVIALIGAVAGYVIYDKATTVDFGEIVIENIPEKDENDTRIISFNVRCADDPEGSIKNRSKIVLAILEQYAPDSFGVQEANGKWMKIFEKNLSEKYACVSQTRGKDKNDETSAVYYLKDKYELIDSDTIWLSDTPDVPYTKHEDSRNIRIATWAVLKNKETGKSYTHINTHLDHISDEARVLQAQVLNNKIRELTQDGTPLVCTGDFNCDKTTIVYEEMLKLCDDTRIIAENTDDGITYHAYGTKEERDDGAIDFAFVTKGTEAKTYKVIRDTAKGMYPSDHYPVVADIKI